MKHNSIKKIRQLLSLHSIKARILCSMLIICSCTIVFYMITAIRYSHKNMLDSSIQSSLQDLTSAQNNTDNLLAIVEDFSIILATDETIQKTLASSDTQKASELSLNQLLLRTKINDIIGTFPRINAVLLSDNADNIYDSGVTVVDKESVCSSQLGWASTYKAPYYISVIGKYTQPNIISYSRIIYNYRTGAPIGKISLYIDEEYIKTTYSSEENDHQLLFLLSYNNHIISSNNTEHLYGEAPISVHQMSEADGFLITENSYYIYKNYPQLECYFVKEIPKDTIEKILHKMQFFMIAIGILLFCITAIISVLLSRHLTRDITTLSYATMQVKDGDWDVYIDCSTDDEIGKLTQNFNAMLSEIKDTTNRLVNEQRTKREYQFELLNQQINPHFLYNTLDNICALAELGYSVELIELVSNLSVFYRGVLSKGSLIISLEKELNIAVSYLKIMQTRYHETFSFEINIDREIMQTCIPKLTLQPILENAIYHGFESHERGGIIIINVKPLDKEILIEVRDNGRGMETEVLEKILKEDHQNEKNSFALRNVHNRLQLYYGLQYGIKVDSTIGTGTTISILLPYQLWKEAPYVNSVDC